MNCAHIQEFIYSYTNELYVQVFNNGSLLGIIILCFLYTTRNFRETFNARNFVPVFVLPCTGVNIPVSKYTHSQNFPYSILTIEHIVTNFTLVLG